jgi:dolichyl-diphosphooligosaccharide--protein glycosyltransferase/undecaprenyl-diphosphooligosaccharide--protein glycosyltransferase
LSRIAIETYVKSGYRTVADTLFETHADPSEFLRRLRTEDDVELPEKTRDIYLYLPYRMLNIFPTVAVFGNLDLNSGKEERKIVFYPTQAISNKNGVLKFRNGLVFDANKGQLFYGKNVQSVRQFVVTQNKKSGKIALQAQNYDPSGRYSIVYMKSYGRFVVMDNQTFHSMYIQMFMLGRYDKNLFELVVSSPYSRIYKLKK